MDYKNGMMKKTVILICAIVAFAGAEAQSHKVQLGVLGGMDSYFSRPSYNESQYAWSTGISIQHNLKKHFSLNYRVLYREERIKQDFTSWWGVFDIGRGEILEKSIVIPVLAKWTFGQGKWHWMVDVGIQSQLINHAKWTNDKGFSYLRKRNDVLLGISSGLGVSYDLSEKIAVNTELRVMDFNSWSEGPLFEDGVNGQLFLGVSYGL